MKTLALFVFGIAALQAAQPVPTRAKVARAAVKQLDENFDNRLRAMFPADPVSVLGVTQGAYIPGYGVVFMGEVNLAPSAGISPFHPTITKEEVVRIHQKKTERLQQLKDAMAAMLISSAALLDAVPDNEQVTLAVSLFHWHWEDTSGLPQQIVMHGQRKVLAGMQGAQDKNALLAAVSVEQF